MNDIKEMKIVAPEGYKIDRINSTLDKIIFKKIEVKKWRDDDNQVKCGFYISFTSNITPVPFCFNSKENRNVFATAKQAKSALAMARISQIMANDERFGGPLTDKEWTTNIHKYVIYRIANNITKDVYYGYCYVFLAFHTEEQRDLFLKENEDLVKDYLMLP